MNKRCTVSLKGIKTGQTEQISECAAAGWVIFPLSLSYTHTHRDGCMFMRAHRHIYIHTGMHHAIIYTHTQRNTHALPK